MEFSGKNDRNSVDGEEKFRPRARNQVGLNPFWLKLAFLDAKKLV